MDANAAIQALADAIIARVEEGVANISIGIRPRLLDVDGAAAYIGRTPAGIRGLVSGGHIPVVRIDSKVQFDVRDLDRVIENAKEGPR